MPPPNAKRPKLPRPGPSKPMQTSAGSSRPTQPTLEDIARGLKEYGYNAAVVSRKMIVEHGMQEEAANELVGRLYGKKVSARSGDTTSAVIGNSIAAVACALLAYLSFLYVPKFRIFVALFFLSLCGAAVSRVIIALVNAGAKDDLAQRRDG